MPIPNAVEIQAAVMTKNKTFGGFVLKEKAREINVPKRVTPPIRISIMPITKIIRNVFKRFLLRMSLLK
jgi:hypothetical protein